MLKNKPRVMGITPKLGNESETVRKRKTTKPTGSSHAGALTRKVYIEYRLKRGY